MRRGRASKTVMMQLIELRFNQRPIEELMVEAFQQYRTEHGAALALGITQQTFNAWKYRLGIERQIHAIAMESSHANAQRK